MHALRQKISWEDMLASQTIVTHRFFVLFAYRFEESFHKQNKSPKIISDKNVLVIVTIFKLLVYYKNISMT